MRGGENVRLPKTRDGKFQHTLVPVYSEMLLQICRDYAGLPDYRTLTLSEIRFFYGGLRPELQAATKPRPRKGTS